MADPQESSDNGLAHGRWWYSLLFIVLVAFAARELVIVVGHTYRITPRRDHFQFGWEMGRLARSVAMGQGFSSPTDLDTGPSAWAPPVYAYILAGIFNVFGVYSAASAFVILTFNSVFAALTCVTLYAIADKLYGLTIARAAAWTWALFPYFIYWPTRVVWETSLTTFLLSLALWMTFRIGEQAVERTFSWLAYGVLWGVIMLTNTAVVSMFPFCLLWILYRARQRSKRLPYALLSVVVAGLVVSPWIVRNYLAFDKFIFVRDNLALELHMANSQESSGLWTRNEHPANDPAAMNEFQKLGEIGFMQQKGLEFREFVHEHPREFCIFTLKRTFYFWAAPPSLTITSQGYDLSLARHTGFFLGACLAFAGLALSIRKRVKGSMLLASFLLLYPLPYYLVNPFPRYKAPIEPEMLVLIIFLFSEAKRVQINFPSREDSV